MPWTDEELKAYFLFLNCGGDRSSFRFEVQAIPEPWQGTGYKLNSRDLTFSQADQVNDWIHEELRRFEEKKAK